MDVEAHCLQPAMCPVCRNYAKAFVSRAGVLICLPCNADLVSLSAPRKEMPSVNADST